MEQLGKLMLVAPEASQEVLQILERRSNSLAFPTQTCPESTEVTVFVSTLEKLRLQRGLPALAPNEARSIAAAWMEAMSDVPIEFFDEVIKRAVMNNEDIDVPFGIPQLRAAWSEVKNEVRGEVMKAESEIVIAEIRMMAECEHEYDFYPRAEDDPLMIRGYHICRHCDRAIPVMEKTSKTAKQIAYLTAAISADVA